MKNNIHDYRDIIDIEKPNFNNYPKMSLEDRAAQFAPFAALVGHKSALDEKARLTSQKLILDENQKEIIDRNFALIYQEIKRKPSVKIIYFLQDKNKSGGKYIEMENNIKKIDEIEKKIIFIDNKFVKIEDVYSIELIK